MVTIDNAYAATAHAPNHVTLESRESKTTTYVTYLYKMGNKSGYYIVRYRPKKVIWVKNVVYCFFAYIDSIDPLLSKYAFNPAVIKVVKRQHFIRVRSYK